jgi:hypothetical protein
MSPKLSGRHAEILEISAETPKVTDIPENFTEIPEIFERRKMLNLSGDFRGVSGPILILTANFWVQSLHRFRNLTAQRLPSPLPFVAAGSSHGIDIYTDLRSSPYSRFARDLRKEASWG